MGVKQLNQLARAWHTWCMVVETRKYEKMRLAVRRQLALGQVEMGYHILTNVLRISTPLNAPAVAFHVWSLAAASRGRSVAVQLDVVRWNGNKVAVARTVRHGKTVNALSSLDEKQHVRWARIYTRLVMASVDEQRRRQTSYMRWWAHNPRQRQVKDEPRLPGSQFRPATVSSPSRTPGEFS